MWNLSGFAQEQGIEKLHLGPFWQHFIDQTTNQLKFFAALLQKWARRGFTDCLACIEAWIVPRIKHPGPGFILPQLHPHCTFSFWSSFGLVCRIIPNEPHESSSETLRWRHRDWDWVRRLLLCIKWRFLRFSYATKRAAELKTTEL